ncbi:MAG: TlpA family protein disulfide reductase [bacterium]|nr:TlpA family protein disulfide reductase [bacterium]
MTSLTGSKAVPLLLSALLCGASAGRAESVDHVTADQFGAHHDLHQAGAYTVVEFAASWCEPCYRTLPRFQELSAEYPEVRFLVVSVDDEVAGRDRLVADLELRLPVIWDEGQVLIERFAPRGFPATYVLDAAGEVVHRHAGTSKKKWRALVEFLSGLPPA